MSNHLISTVGLSHFITLLHSEAGFGVSCHGRLCFKIQFFMFLKLHISNYGYFNYEKSNK
jgi:hypothetical protein